MEKMQERFTDFSMGIIKRTNEHTIFMDGRIFMTMTYYRIIPRENPVIDVPCTPSAL